MWIETSCCPAWSLDLGLEPIRYGSPLIHMETGPVVLNLLECENLFWASLAAWGMLVNAVRTVGG